MVFETLSLNLNYYYFFTLSAIIFYLSSYTRCLYALSLCWSFTPPCLYRCYSPFLICLSSFPFLKRLSIKSSYEELLKSCWNMSVSLYYTHIIYIFIQYIHISSTHIYEYIRTHICIYTYIFLCKLNYMFLDV